EVISGGPTPSGPMPPCACARPGSTSKDARAAILTRHTGWITVNGQFLIHCRIILVISISESFDVAPDRPHGEIAANELANPVADKGRRAAEGQGDILCFA